MYNKTASFSHENQSNSDITVLIQVNHFQNDRTFNYTRMVC